MGSWAGSSRLLRIALASLKSRMKVRIFISEPQNGLSSGARARPLSTFDLGANPAQVEAGCDESERRQEVADWQ